MKRTSPKWVATTPARSQLMGRVRQEGSAPELVVRAMLRRQGYKFKSNAKKLPGSPDIYSPWAKVAIFVHGCFWHRHRDCRACTTPKQNRRFWLEKFYQNVARDQRKARQLRRLGYRILTVWECEVKSPSKLATLERRLQRFFGGKGWASLRDRGRDPRKNRAASLGPAPQDQRRQDSAPRRRHGGSASLSPKIASQSFVPSQRVRATP